MFTFLAQQIAKEDHCLTVSRQLFEQVLDVLTDTKEKSHHEERQQALLDMLNAGGLDYFDRDHLIFRAQKVGFFRILEMLYYKNCDYVKLIRTYIDDNFRQNQVFNFAQKLLTQDDDHDKKGQVEKSILDDLPVLIGIDCKKTSNLIFFHMYPYIPLVLAKLEPNKPQLFEFLKYLLELKENGSQPSTPNRSSIEDPLISQQTYENLIELMAQIEPKSLSTYIQTKSNYYRSEIVLKIAQKYDIKDAQAYLLEQDGKFQEAFDLMISDLKSQLSDLDPEKPLTISKLKATVYLIIPLCQRSSLILDEENRDKMWFTLLDFLMKKAENKDTLKPLIKHVLTSSLGHISLRSVIDRVLKGYQSDNLLDLLKDLLEMYHYEETLMKSTTQAIYQDTHSLLVQQQQLRKKAFCVKNLNCDLCGRHLAFGGQNIVFECGHKYHSQCLSKAGCQKKGQKWLCYLCLKNEGQIIQEDEVEIQDDEENFEEKIVNEIIDQQVVKAHSYLGKLKAKDTQESIFEREDFSLNLSPKPRAE